MSAKQPKPGAPRPNDKSLVVGPTRFGWLFGKTKKWGARMLKRWAAEQADGGPLRVFVGTDGALYTTMAVIHQWLPPGRDLALYRRMEGVEHDIADAHRRIDREAIRVSEIERRLARIEQRRKAG